MAGSACLFRHVAEDIGNGLLKGVSRSFYLSLRLLPHPMRRAAGLGYLLARTSDTIADTASVDPILRQQWLDHYENAISSGSVMPEWPSDLLGSVADDRERKLLLACPEILLALDRLPDEEARLIREVVATIIGGQKLDLARFSSGPAVLTNDGELEDYTWKVAGCVGAFWTRLGYATMGTAFSESNPEALEKLGIRYGKGLQLVNILRDLPEDLANGRCYLPVMGSGNQNELLEIHAKWLGVAMEWVADGLEYGKHLKGRRLKAASILPAMIAMETLEAMRGADMERLRQRVKVPRSRIYQLVLRAFFQA